MKFKPRTLSAHYFNSHIEILDRMGWPRSSQLQCLGFDETYLFDPRNRIDLVDANRLYNRAAELFSEPNIGILIGHKFRVATFVETGSILAFSDSLAHAAEINQKYEMLAETAGDCSLVREDGRVFLQWIPKYDEDDDLRHITEIIFGGYVATIRWLAWVYEKDIKALYFRHKAPDSLKTYTETLQCPVHFEAEFNRLEFHPETVDLPLPTSNPDKMAKMCARLDKILIGAQGQSPLEVNLRNAIRQVIANQTLSFEAVSRHMEVPQRRLRHELKKIKLSYRDTVDAVRKDMFDQLSRLNSPLTETAQTLGYSDQSAFTRAFRRWYGMSPSAYKAQQINY